MQFDDGEECVGDQALTNSSLSKSMDFCRCTHSYPSPFPKYYNDDFVEVSHPEALPASKRKSKGVKQKSDKRNKNDKRKKTDKRKKSKEASRQVSRPLSINQPTRKQPSRKRKNT